MNIIELQNMIDETKQPLKGNSVATNVAPTARKVYSKPTLVVLTQIYNSEGAKQFANREQSQISPPSGTS